MDAKLQERLDAFLAEPVGDGYGWPDVSREHLNELYGIFSEIADQKFRRDCDRDQVIDFTVSNRKSGRLIYAVIPHMPDDEFPDERIEEEAWRQWFYDATRATHLLIAQATEVLRLIPEYMHMRDKKSVD